MFAKPWFIISNFNLWSMSNAWRSAMHLFIYFFKSSINNDQKCQNLFIYSSSSFYGFIFHYFYRFISIIYEYQLISWQMIICIDFYFIYFFGILRCQHCNQTLINYLCLVLNDIKFITSSITLLKRVGIKRTHVVIFLNFIYTWNKVNDIKTNYKPN